MALSGVTLQPYRPQDGHMPEWGHQGVLDPWTKVPGSTVKERKHV